MLNLERILAQDRLMRAMTGMNLKAFEGNYSARGKGLVPRKTCRSASRTSMPCFLRVEM
jgi:hypothetical protein